MQIMNIKYSFPKPRENRNLEEKKPLTCEVNGAHFQENFFYWQKDILLLS